MKSPISKLFCIPLLPLFLFICSPQFVVSQQTTTPDEAAVLERAQELRGTVQRNAAGRILGLDITSAELTLADMQLIARLPDIETIRLVGPAVNDAYVETLRGLTTLHTVDIQNSSITDRSLVILAELPNIHTLRLRRNLNFTDRAITLFAEFPNLRELRILYNAFTPMALFDLGNLTTVRVLDLRALPITDSTLMFIGDLENLEELRVRSSSVTNNGVAHLKNCTNLRVLEFQDADVSTGLAEILKDFENLRFLRIFRCAPFGPDAITELGMLTQLDTLELRGLACSPEALRALKPLANLRSVEFSELGNVDSAVLLEVLQAFPDLHTIRLFGIPADDTIAAHIATRTGMRRVLLPATAITDAGLEPLTTMEGLIALDIHANRIHITPQGAMVLSKFRDLRQLTIPETIDSPAFRAAMRENSPRIVITINSYAHVTGE